MVAVVFIREFIKRLVQVLPFLLGAVYCPYPLAIVFPCLLVLKNSAVSSGEITEIKMMLMILLRSESEKNPGTVGKLYQPLRAALLHDQETYLEGLEDAARAEMLSQTLLDIAEKVLIYVLIVYGSYRVLHIYL